MKAKLEKSVRFIPWIVDNLEGFGAKIFRGNLKPEVPEIKITSKLKTIHLPKSQLGEKIKVIATEKVYPLLPRHDVDESAKDFPACLWQLTIFV